MSTIARALSGSNLSFDLSDQITSLREDESYARSGRLGRTLVKDGNLRLTLTVLAQGTDVGTHHADAPMTLQPLQGRVRYRLEGEEIDVGQGDVVFFARGHATDIHALEDSALLLTINQPDSEEPSAGA